LNIIFFLELIVAVQICNLYISVYHSPICPSLLILSVKIILYYLKFKLNNFKYTQFSHSLWTLKNINISSKIFTSFIFALKCITYNNIYYILRLCTINKIVIITNYRFFLMCIHDQYVKHWFQYKLLL